MPRSLEMREGQKYSQIFQRKPNSNMGISEYMFVHVIYPRNTQAYSDAWTSNWMNQKGYITFAY